VLRGRLPEWEALGLGDRLAIVMMLGDRWVREAETARDWPQLWAASVRFEALADLAFTSSSDLRDPDDARAGAQHPSVVAD